MQGERVNATALPYILHGTFPLTYILHDINTVLYYILSTYSESRLHNSKLGPASFDVCELVAMKVAVITCTLSAFVLQFKKIKYRTISVCGIKLVHLQNESI